MEKVMYYHKDLFSDFLIENVKQRNNFVLEKTSYTKKMKFDNGLIYIFNETGSADFKVLSLINKVRTECGDYVKHQTIPEVDINTILWSRLKERPPKTLVSKIDISSAYWNFALKNNIISKRTDDSLKELYPNAKNMKSARLKALGSLATRKQIFKYVEGEPVDFQVKENPLTRNLYLHICMGIDSIMNGIVDETVGAYFYYWDCIFVRKDCEHKVFEYLRDTDYHFKTEHITQEVVKLAERKYLHTIEDDISYIISPEEEYLLYL